MSRNTYIISLGGSLIIPQATQTVNVSYLQQLSTLINTHVALGKRFFIITGGGYTARHYQQAAETSFGLSPTHLDWLGIYATHLNAHFVRLLFSDISYPHIIAQEKDLLGNIEDFPIVVAGGWHPGNSTDYIAVKIAEMQNISKVINLSNIDYLYTADPRKYADASPILTITWSEFRKMVGDTWDPGASAPFDPIASIEAEKHNIEVSILNGENIENLNAYLSNDTFIGTRIS
jgi:uridylate kinase